ncbi:MAG TPA: PRC-barrel domain-containing protein [Hyphomicrobiaceae bacterium]|nr:PRC-barrel domain-containing protein [Hyphomicrobiaceae bacterium]
MNELAFVGRLGRVAVLTAALSANSSAVLSQPDPLLSPQLQSVLGREVTPPRGKGVESGRIIDVLIDAEGDVHAFVVEFGGFLGIGTRKVAVDRAAFQFAGGKIFVEITAPQLQSVREWKRGEPPDVVKAASPPGD